MTQANEKVPANFGITKARPNSHNYIDPLAIRRRKNWNPRFDFGEIEELAKSIQQNGMLMPVRVKKVEAQTEGKTTTVFELIDGDRRLTAVEHLISKGIKFEEGIPAILEMKDSSDVENLIKMFESNSGKAFLPLEEAAAFKRMREAGMTLQQIEARVGRSHLHIVDTMRLLEAAPEVQKAVKDKKISSTTAKAIAKASKEKQAELVDKAANAKKGERTQLRRTLEKERTNRRNTTATRAIPMELAELRKFKVESEKAYTEFLEANGLGDRGLNAIIKEGKNGQVKAAYLLGIFMASQAALGYELPF